MLADAKRCEEGLVSLTRLSGYYCDLSQVALEASKFRLPSHGNCSSEMSANWPN